ncbi:MAG: hypothetical protein GXY87_05790 [Tissierellia bacterium]|nr:hypothetical protein [Tissierellia bacterium]
MNLKNIKYKKEIFFLYIFPIIIIALLALLPEVLISLSGLDKYPVAAVQLMLPIVLIVIPVVSTRSHVFNNWSLKDSKKVLIMELIYSLLIIVLLYLLALRLQPVMEAMQLKNAELEKMIETIK